MSPTFYILRSSLFNSRNRRYKYTINEGSTMKKRFQNLSLTQQMSIPIAIVGFCVLGVNGYLSSKDQFELAKHSAETLSLEMTEKYSQEVKNYFDKPFAQIQTIGKATENDLNNSDPNRPRLYSNLRSLLESEKEYLATWSAWEPNAFDGKDASHINDPTHEKTGRVYPWWIREGDTLVYKTVINEETPNLDEWYTTPMSKKTSVILDPYSDTVNGKQKVMTSAVYTVVKNGTALGILGVDISLQTLSDLMAKIKLFENSEAYLISDKGMIVAGPKDDLLMKEFSKDPKVMDRLSSHKVNLFKYDSERGSEQYVVAPVSIYNLDTQWSLVIRTPIKNIMATSYTKLWYQLIISLIGLLVLQGIVHFVAKKAEKKISLLSEDLKISSDVISAEVSHLNSTGAHLAQSSSKAAASIEETSANVEIITNMVKLNSENAKNAARLSEESAQLVQLGEDKLKELVIKMNQIERSSTKIEEITNIIDDISFQTNLLALNASVEAARAGEHGRGFAVVADAVRSLAQRAASAAKDINQLISTSVEQVKQGTSLVEANERVLSKMTSSIGQVASLNKEIATASEQQSMGVEQVNTALTLLDQVIQGNASEASEIVSIATQIREKSEVMNDTVKILSAR